MNIAVRPSAWSSPGPVCWGWMCSPGTAPHGSSMGQRCLRLRGSWSMGPGPSTGMVSLLFPHNFAPTFL